LLACANVILFSFINSLIKACLFFSLVDTTSRFLLCFYIPAATSAAIGKVSSAIGATVFIDDAMDLPTL
jgi:hypothetical protein